MIPLRNSCYFLITRNVNVFKGLEVCKLVSFIVRWINGVGIR